MTSTLPDARRFRSEPDAPTCKVSVIIPTYNSAPQLSRALDSVYRQTFDDYEVIVVDDGSSDDTETMIRRNYPTAKLLKQANSGASAARNHGARVATGELLAFLDADDQWSEDKLTLQTSRFDRSPELAMVFTDNDMIDQDGNYRGLYQKRERLMEGDPVRNIFLNSGVCTSTVMMRRTTFLDEGGFQESLITAEDDDLWIRVAAKYPIALIEKPLVMYTIAEGSLSRKEGNIFKGVSQHLRLMETQEEYAAIRQRLGRLIPKKWSELHFSEGWHHMDRNQLTTARKHFLSALRFNPLRPVTAAYLLLSLLPLPMLDLLRRAKRTASRTWRG